MRKFVMMMHLWMAAIAAPIILMLAVSGGLYLLGEKGAVKTIDITLPIGTQLDFSSGSLDKDIDNLISQLGIDHSYEYLKNRGAVVQTRPTSRAYLEFSKKDGALSLTHNEPSLLASMMELHKGHGPRAFKFYQQVVALGLVVTILSGLWMGFKSHALRFKTLGGLAVGFIVFIVVVMF